MSAGIWGEDPQLNAAKRHDLSARVRLSHGNKNSYHVSFREREHTHKKVNADGETGWFGTISKTTDGGLTWQTVFESDRLNDYYYFNSISCSSEDHCVAVAEGDDAVNGGYLVRAFVTFDGGVTWTNALTEDVVPSTVVSMMGASWASETEGWLAGTGKNGRKLSGLFFHTVDGGKTYALAQVTGNVNYCHDTNKLTRIGVRRLWMIVLSWTWTSRMVSAMLRALTLLVPRAASL